MNRILPFPLVLLLAACGGTIDSPPDAAPGPAAPGDAALEAAAPDGGGDVTDAADAGPDAADASSDSDACGWQCFAIAGGIPGGMELVNTCTGGAASCADVEARCGGICVLDGGTPL